MLTRRNALMGAITAGAVMRTTDRICQSLPACHTNQFRRSRKCVRLPHAHPRRPEAIPFLLGSRLHSRTGIP
jgi:hypothetical protein